ncbi:MAG: hypothetical protein IT372_18535, partial [Polyangiaceae bacterium]|nr:hypothetical protein [Polyangiaceae bacterium]
MRDVRMRGFRERTTVEAALAVLDRRVARLGDELVPIAEAAGRVAAEDVAARASVPHFARSAMDGYAVAGESTFGATAYAPITLAITGDSRPGRPRTGIGAEGAARRPGAPNVEPGAIGRGEAIRIATGALVPEGADAVV